MSGSTGLGEHPRPYLPGWRVADVLRMPTFEFSHPVHLGVLMEPDDSSIRDH